MTAAHDARPGQMIQGKDVVRVARRDVLVGADWVEAHAGDLGVVLVEVDAGSSAYDKGHIRNAVKIDWVQDLQDPVRRDVVDGAGFEALLSRRGVGNDDTVVLYGGSNNWFAAFAYWCFKLYGHEKVKLLDGGRKKWELDSRALVTGEPPRRPATSYLAQKQDTAIRAFRDEVVAAVGRRNLVDVRSPDEFAGFLLAPAHLPQEQAQRGGHVPTARNVPWSEVTEEDGTFKPGEVLRAVYSGAGVLLGRDTIVYCRNGERSAHTWFVLHELLGQRNVKNYDGSWAEYGCLVGVPVSKGA
jgi:thiosulfate/3-mercaptopyruvate sulfurtransferase